MNFLSQNQPNEWRVIWDRDNVIQQCKATYTHVKKEGNIYQASGVKTAFNYVVVE